MVWGEGEARSWWPGYQAITNSASKHATSSNARSFLCFGKTRAARNFSYTRFLLASGEAQPPDTQIGQFWPVMDKPAPWPQLLFAFPFPPLPQLEGHSGATGSCQPRSHSRTSPPVTQHLVRPPLLMPLKPAFSPQDETSGLRPRTSGHFPGVAGEDMSQGTTLTKAMVCSSKLNPRSTSIQVPKKVSTWGFNTTFQALIFMSPEGSLDYIRFSSSRTQLSLWLKCINNAPSWCRMLAKLNFQIVS